MKIALFGGSFDPPHNGHSSVIKETLSSLDIDKLIIMPTFINPFKKGFFADEMQRLKWIKKLWGDLERVEILDYEIKQKRPVPSIESVLYLQELFRPKKFYLIIGADHLENLHKWHDFEKLALMVEFVIANRDNISIPKKFRKLDTHINISSSFIRKTLDTKEVCADIKEDVKRYYKNLQKG
ncbi:MULTISPECIES: nicotinate (nicotinamide) nucleotide adenylyltransferase [unclassified Campylobacter]|uniref:nicotinate (nicotinamide) nucleotide adenylyltransferase n=1 Tax=unclassified Campylobacter TaxID=2593542 RepID=UPI001237DF58|nr:MULTISPECIES: nicotinate (nicotinamide) nucleotide adenylyltransferase [unclassified Campylobacter]KAA6225193.1 nicotinate (nicotinamide) nucleotide adenylyltransferase [Campylobacter sp. LR196d]KAA6226205.1 nicotinate (nicotinamide) nucleotide adenylyltransferase [Campylobacter sp. LR185c]KAA6228995.1 nicotinate (nicotinamide) nucleotide adenylyltransferase [Campylobacter sp. LR286c]KAA6231406.1 nicotinate (nicotinamide) nucleotide adenylyltransferase [Campylobacter sp. LR264d]KAA6231618.1